MNAAGKSMTWTRWAVMIGSQYPPSTYEILRLCVTDGPRFKVVAMGVNETQVRAVVEYTARGANSDDIKRRFTVHGIPRENIETISLASVEVEWDLNADLVSVIDRSVLSDPAA